MNPPARGDFTLMSGTCAALVPLRAALVPLLRPRGADPEQTTVDAGDAVRAFKDDLEVLGLRVEAGEHRDRGGHDLRSWFITTCQAHGAHRDLLRMVTHTAKGNVVSGYTRAQWPALCAEVPLQPLTTMGSWQGAPLTRTRRIWYRRHHAG